MAPPKAQILIRNALEILTMDSRNSRLRDASLLMEGNRIAAVGKNIKVKAGTREIDAKGCVALPGFVNLHHHLYQTLFRNLPEVQNAALFDWLKFLYEKWRRITPEAVRLSALVGLGELLLTGCTTSADHFYVFPKSQPGTLLDDEIRAAKKIGIRFHPTRGSMSRGKSSGGLPPDDLVQDENEILKDCERVLARYHDAEDFSMCRVGLAPCSPFSITPELLKETARLARKNKRVLCHTHLAETLDEERFCLETHGKRPVAYMEGVDWLGEDVWFAHAVHLSDEEIRLLAATKTGAAHCPSSNLRLGSGVARLRKMLDAGMRVGLGVDGSSSNDTSDMLAELRMCLLIHRLNGVSSMTAMEVLRMATKGGAEILGRPEIGELSVGKAADVILINLNKLPYAGSLSDPAAAILFCGASHIVEYAIVNGEVVVEKGRLVKIDEEEVARKANALSQKILRN